MWTRSIFHSFFPHTGRLDILVNNACDPGTGIEDSGKFWWERDTMAHYDAHTTVGLRSHYLCSLIAAKAMVSQQSGLIVNISSFGAMRRYM